MYKRQINYYPSLFYFNFSFVLVRFYKGIVPLWGRQIPYTMMKFACFERTIEALYKYVVPKPRSQCSKPEQLVVTFIAGYIGMFTFVVCLSSVLFLNNYAVYAKKGDT